MEITNYVSHCIKEKTPVAFLKFGDGEYAAAAGHAGHNCDRDTYTDSLKNGLINSMQNMVNNGPNTFIGIWHDGNHIDFWKSFVERPIRTAKYHTVVMDGENTAEKVNLLKTIKESSLKKIYVCNPLMVRAKILLNIDHMIHVPFNNWVDTKFEAIFEEVKNACHADVNEPCIVLTSAGMGAKMLISELTKLYPQNIYIDIGSGLDKICTKKTSRGWEPSYEDFMRILADIIPHGWESPEYQRVFDEAVHKLGVHL